LTFPPFLSVLVCWVCLSVGAGVSRSGLGLSVATNNCLLGNAQSICTVAGSGYWVWVLKYSSGEDYNRDALCSMTCTWGNGMMNLPPC